MSKERTYEFLDWAYDRRFINNRRVVIAVVVAGISVVVALACIISVDSLMALQKIEPIVITLDKGTGVTNVITERTGKPEELTDAIVYSEAGKYLLLREAYMRATFIDNYKTAVQMSDGKARTELIAKLAPDKKTSPYLALEDRFQINVVWTSFSMLPNNVVQIRFIEERIDAADEHVMKRNRVATIRFTHLKDAQMSLNMRIKNPMAFVVTDYQVATEGGAK